MRVGVPNGNITYQPVAEALAMLSAYKSITEH